MRAASTIVAFTMLVACSFNTQNVTATEQATGVAYGPPELGVAYAISGEELRISMFRMFTVRCTPEQAGITPSPRDATVGVKQDFTSRASFPTTIAIKEIAVRRMNGESVSAETVARELAAATPVVLGVQGEPIDPVFAKMFKPNTIVLLLPKKMYKSRTAGASNETPESPWVWRPPVPGMLSPEAGAATPNYSAPNGISGGGAWPAPPESVAPITE